MPISLPLLSVSLSSLFSLNQQHYPLSSSAMHFRKSPKNTTWWPPKYYDMCGKHCHILDFQVCCTIVSKLFQLHYLLNKKTEWCSNAQENCKGFVETLSGKCLMTALGSFVSSLDLHWAKSYADGFLFVFYVAGMVQSMISTWSQSRESHTSGGNISN